MITHVAIKDANGRVYALPKPQRHAALFQQFPELRTVTTGGILLTRDGQVQGFIADGTGCSGWFISDAPEKTRGCGRFLNRIDGAAHALHVGQIKKLDHPPNLYSEDLW